MIVGVAVVALLPESLAKRSPASRVDDVLSVAANVRQLKKAGDAVVFMPTARRDTKLVSPNVFAGLRDIALARSPTASVTLKGEEADPGRIRTAMREQQRILLVTDAPEVARPISAKRDIAKNAVLHEDFKVVAVEQVLRRRVTVYERRGRRP